MTDIIVPIEESASYVEDTWPDEAAYIAKEAAAKERERIRASAVPVLDVIDGIVDDTHPEGDGCPLCVALDDLRAAIEGASE